jgi:co-chaperonin GroES (HSP10)
MIDEIMDFYFLMNELIIVGDRVLISPDEGEKQTESGLVLPAGVAEREKVRSGRVNKVGPGYVMPNPDYTAEPWASERDSVRYLPLQARPGDFAFFLQKEAIEIKFEGKNYVIVNHAAILALVRRQREDLPDDIEGVDIEDLLN